MTYPMFLEDIEAMNRRYQLGPIAGLVPICDRLPKFKDILDKEFTELEDIESALEEKVNSTDTQDLSAVAMMVKVEMADLLADIIVYCTSEAARWGIPIDAVLKIVLASNTSKLGADGQPIINKENGKFEKGPNYWKPEPAIRQLLTYGGEYVHLHKNDAGVFSVELKEGEKK